MTLNQIILGFLMDRCMTGYEIRQKFSMSFSFFSGISFGAIYPALKSLEKDGLIVTRLEIQEGAPNKKICTITEKGREQFRKSLREALPPDRYKNAFISKMFFFSHLSHEERIAAARAYLDELKSTRNALDALQPIIQPHADPFQYLCFQCGQRIMDDMERTMQWAMESLASMETTT